MQSDFGGICDTGTSPERSTMKIVPALPHIVWRHIVSHLSDDLATLLDLASLCMGLKDICRRCISRFFESIDTPVAPIPSNFYYHHLARLILQGYINPIAIHEFHHHVMYKAKSQSFPSLTARPGMLANATEEQVARFDDLVSKAVREMTIIPLDLQLEILTQFRQGDEGAALAVLLPLLTGLRMLEPPARSKLCRLLFQHIAKAYREQDASAQAMRLKSYEAAIRERDSGLTPIHNTPHLRQTLPFSQLLFLHVEADQFGFSFPLAELVPFMGIPSLHRMVLEGLVDKQFPGWKTEDGTCSCPEVYFQQSAVSPEAVLAFAEGLDPPCEIRQWYQRPRPDIAESSQGDPQWDRVLIQTHEGHGRSVDISLDYEGGNPGTQHPWVSWLAWGKMHDWRRIDQEFKNDEDDEAIEYLLGGLI